MPISYQDFRPYLGKKFWYQAPKTVTKREARLVEILNDSSKNIQLNLELKDIGVVLVNATPDVLKQIKRYPV